MADFGFLDGVDDDVTAMLLLMARRIANNGRLILGEIQIKKIQSLVWWVRYRQKFGQSIDVALWKFAAMMNSGIAKCIEKYQTKADMNAADLKE